MALDDEASDAANEVAVVGDRPQGGIGSASHPGHVGVERSPVVWIPGGECRHPDRLWITHLVEQPVQIGILDRPQLDGCTRTPSISLLVHMRNLTTSSVTSSMVPGGPRSFRP